MDKGYQTRGFTLIELMVALFILSIGLLGMIKMQMSSIQGNAFSGRMTTAIALAQDQMEIIINQDLDPWEDVTDTLGNPTLMGRQYAGYTVNWTITTDVPTPNLATVNVEVQWPGGTNPVRQVSYKRR
ncbi:MAG: prepilin-type N-terminal cleavage/methylation domain-containing protein [Desulfatiglandales bacterium]